MGYPRKSQTVTATPAKPGELSILFRYFVIQWSTARDLTKQEVEELSSIWNKFVGAHNSAMQQRPALASEGNR